jgi:hypothetical protein
VRARVRNGAIWSALNQAQFYPPQDFSKLQLSEIMYNPPKFGSIDGDEVEFLELTNTGTNRLELTGVTFSRGINFVFTNETALAPGGYLVLARNPTQFAAKYPGAPLHGIYTGKLDNNGETIAMATALGVLIFSVSYDNAAPWPAEADNSGLSLQRMNFTTEVTNALAWIAAPPTPGGPLPAELLDRDGDGLPDGWELARNVTDPNEDSDGDGFTNLEEFRAGTDPRDEDDRLRLQAFPANPGSPNVVVGFNARSNKTYSLLFRRSVDTGAWSNLVNFDSQPTNRFIRFPIINSYTNSLFFRMATPRLP